MVSNAALYSRRHPDRLVNPHKVVVRKPLIIGRLLVLPLLQKCFTGGVIRRIPMRIERFCRSTWDVQMRVLSGLPKTGTGTAMPEENQRPMIRSAVLNMTVIETL